MNQEDYKNQIERLLHGLGERRTRKFYQMVVCALQDEQRLYGQNTFKIPLQKFTDVGITNIGNRKAVLTNLHNEKIIAVSRKINKTRRETIIDNPEIVNNPTADITTYQPAFDYLAQRLTEIVSQYEAAKARADTTEQLKVIECCGIKYSFSTCMLSYKDGTPKQVSPEKRELKFLISLHKNRGKVVEDKDIARDTDMWSYKKLSDNGKVKHESINNKDFSEDVAALRRDCRTLLLSLGMSAEAFDTFIKRIPKKGYKLVCS